MPRARAHPSAAARSCEGGAQTRRDEIKLSAESLATFATFARGPRGIPGVVLPPILALKARTLRDFCAQMEAKYDCTDCSAPPPLPSPFTLPLELRVGKIRVYRRAEAGSGGTSAIARWKTNKNTTLLCPPVRQREDEGKRAIGRNAASGFSSIILKLLLLHPFPEEKINRIQFPLKQGQSMIEPLLTVNITIRSARVVQTSITVEVVRC